MVELAYAPWITPILSAPSCLESRSWQVVLVEVSLFGGSVAEDFHVEGGWKGFPAKAGAVVGDQRDRGWACPMTVALASRMSITSRSARRSSRPSRRWASVTAGCRQCSASMLRLVRVTVMAVVFGDVVDDGADAPDTAVGGFEFWRSRSARLGCVRWVIPKHFSASYRPGLTVGPKSVRQKQSTPLQRTSHRGVGDLVAISEHQCSDLVVAPRRSGFGVFGS
jgi:hypothetical protein